MGERVAELDRKSFEKRGRIDGLERSLLETECQPTEIYLSLTARIT
jgi:hypothetical protein